MAPPSRELVESLVKRPVGPNGLPLNDQALPKHLLDWQDRGGFWGRVAGYYIQKHQATATVYRSPFTAMNQQTGERTLAERYYESLEPEQRVRIDQVRGEVNE